MGDADVQHAANRLGATLDEMGIAYALCGALAVTAHGHVRTTLDVDVLITRQGLARFKERWLGRGWVERFQGSNGLRDTLHNIKIDVLLTGDYPGDGKPKAVAFPDPAHVALPDTQPRVISLAALVELKTASGMTAPERPRDFDDVIQLIRVNHLPRTYGGTLNSYVQPKFEELWDLAQIRRGEED